MPPRKVVEVARDPMRYLKARGGKWHYVRRVPTHFSHIDDRGTIRVSLKTASIDVAKLRRDAQERADDLFWQGMVIDDDAKAVQAKYQAAKLRASALGFEYKGAAHIAETSSVEEIIRRAMAVERTPNEAPAALGGVDEPKLTVRQAMTLYVEELALDELKGMSTAQVESWRKVKFISVKMYEEVIGKGSILLDTTRADANKFHKHFLQQMKAKDGISGNTANRRFGNIRKLFRVYANHLQLDVKNPFDGLSFSDPKRLRAVVPPFEPEYLQRVWLKGSPFAKLNEQARLILLAMIETGCRPSEIANLKPENIRLKTKIPHLVITYTEDRGLKTENSIRTVPLVGVSLEAMKLAPNGFPRYADKETNLSAALMAFLKENKLFPSGDNYRVYSLRHTYEKRMVEAGYDDEFRRRMLGHDTERPDYGDGGSLEWRRDRMAAIALTYEASVLEGKG